MATSDELIKKNVVDELYWNDSVDASRVKVEVEHGVVFLSGTVSNYRARTASAESAAGIHGVLNVQNRIVVDPNHTAGATPDEIIQDTGVCVSSVAGACKNNREREPPPRTGPNVKPRAEARGCDILDTHALRRSRRKARSSSAPSERRGRKNTLSTGFRSWLFTTVLFKDCPPCNWRKRN